MDGSSNKIVGRSPWVLFLALVLYNLSLVAYGVWHIDDNALGVLVAIGLIIIDILLLFLLLSMVLRVRRLSRELDDKEEQWTHSLADESARLHAVIDNMADGLVVVDRKGRITLVNAAAERMFGWTSMELIGKPIARMLPMRDRKNHTVPESRHPTAQALRGKVVQLCGVANAGFYVRKDGTSFPATVTCAPILVDGESLGAVEVLRDANREFEIDRMKSEFITLTSHQLRTPLTAVQWYVQDMLDGSVGRMSAPQIKHLRDVEQSTRRMIRLVDDLLRVSQIELGQMGVSVSRIDIAPIARRVAEDTEHQSSKKDVRVSVSGIREGAFVRADASVLRQVLVLLISNAILFTPRRGKVNVRIARDGKSYRISVHDMGIGIPQKEQGRVFEQFFRASNAQSLTSDGTGLGLYLAKRLVRMAGGGIGFVSKEKKGSTFWISFPAA